MGVAEKLEEGRPKRLLALDGGGIRGLVSIEILAAVERAVGMPLGSYFDYIAGTSTGAILATCLSLGMSVSQLRQFYLDTGPHLFELASPFRRHLHKYEDARVAETLRALLVEPGRPDQPITLGSPTLQTLLLLVLRNATTDSPWPLTNNPRARFNDRSLPDCNLDFPLWRLVRASTAAPTYFGPEQLPVGDDAFLFVDGGITPYNNPAFLLFLHATLEPYRLCWPTGPENLLVVSVGTGGLARADPGLVAGDMDLLYSAARVPEALMSASVVEQDTLCRIFGRCLHGAPLDSELGDLRWVPGGPAPHLPKLFTYLRYTADLSRGGLERLGLGGIDPAHVQRIDAVDHMEELQRVGQAAARAVSEAHFEGFPHLIRSRDDEL